MPSVRCTVDSEDGLSKVASKAPNARFLVPELADEESPEGWEVMGLSRVRVTATVRQFLEHALYDLTSAIPLEYRSLPAVEEQRDLLRSLLDGRKWPFTVELQSAAGPADDESLESRRYQELEEERGCEFLDVDGPCQSIDEQLGLLVEPAKNPVAVELGAAAEIKRLVIAPGNGCDDILDANWYGWLYERLRAENLFESVVCRDFPDPYQAKRSEWIPFLVDDLAVGPDTILVGHSSGAEAAMRLAEEHLVGGLVLVSACHTDLGLEDERDSGYYPPSGGAWNWKAIRKNTGWIVQFHSRDDSLVPVAEGRFVAEALQSEYHELDGHDHFFEEFEEIIDIIGSKMQM